MSKVRLEHIWVEAALDFHPSRGAINRAADAWIPMDPSFKQYEFLEGLNPVAISGIDPEQLANDFLNSGTVNEEEGWVTGFDPGVLRGALQQTQEALIVNNVNGEGEKNVGSQHGIGFDACDC